MCEVIYEGRRKIVPAGRRGECVVTRDGKPLLPVASQMIVNHSPDGYEWGYGGSGPAQLALALLLDAVSPTAARIFSQEYKAQVVSQFPHEGWKLTRTQVRKWWAEHAGPNYLAWCELARTRAVTLAEEFLSKMEHGILSRDEAEEEIDGILTALLDVPAGELLIRPVDPLPPGVHGDPSPRDFGKGG